MVHLVFHLFQVGRSPCLGLFLRNLCSPWQSLFHFPSCGLNQTRIMAKIENMEGLLNSAEIIEVSDAILLSRGNLGICLDAEKVIVALVASGSDHSVLHI